MQVEIFALCDAATGDHGKLNLLGAFDTLWVAKLPVAHPQCTIALRIRFGRLEKGEHHVAVNFMDMDGKAVIPPLNGQIKVDFPDMHSSSSTNLFLNLQGLKLERLGEYSINLGIDGVQRASIPLFVKERK